MKTQFGDHVSVALDGAVAVVTLNRPVPSPSEENRTMRTAAVT